MLQFLSAGKASETIEFLKKYMPEFYETCRPSVRSAIFSIQFVNYLKKKEHLPAISLIQKSELKSEPFPSVDQAGKIILCRAGDLTKLFCRSDIVSDALEVSGAQSECCMLASQAHIDTVCSFVNKELLSYERSKASLNEQQQSLEGGPKPPAPAKVISKFYKSKPGMNLKSHPKDSRRVNKCNNDFDGNEESFGMKSDNNENMASLIKQRRAAKRDSKLEVLLKQTCLTLSHLNQALPTR